MRIYGNVYEPGETGLPPEPEHRRWDRSTHRNPGTAGTAPVPRSRQIPLPYRSVPSVHPLLRDIFLLLLLLGTLIGITHVPSACYASGRAADIPITLEVVSAPLPEVLRSLEDISGNTILSDTASPTPVTLSLRDRNLETALDSLSFLLDGTWEERDGIIRLRKKGMKTTVRTVLPLDHRTAEDLAPLLTELFPGPCFRPEPGSNSILYAGPGETLPPVRAFLASLDRPVPVVTLEARIISVSREKERDLGMRWEWNTLPAGGDGGANGYPGHIRFPGRTSSRFRFRATLTAMLRDGRAKILATPKISTLPGKEASIFIGSHIPVVTEKRSQGDSTYATEYVDAGIKLTYTPVLGKNGKIISKVHTEVSTPTLVAELKNYKITSRTADTTVPMEDGETLVIGGLISEEEQERLQQIPLLSKLPLLGHLFRHRYRSRHKTEVIMLLTPKIHYPEDGGGKKETADGTSKSSAHKKTPATM